MKKKTKPDYTKFMKKPAALRMSAPDNENSDSPTPNNSDTVPYAEVLLTPEQEALLKRQLAKKPLTSTAEASPVEDVFSSGRQVGVNAPVVITDPEPPSKQQPFSPDARDRQMNGPPPLAILAVALFVVIGMLL